MENGPREIMKSLVKAVKAIQMYHINHPSAKSFYNPLYENMTVYLKEHPVIEYQINQFMINNRGKPVYRAKEKETSIPFRLFRNGIRNISFVKGLSFHELIKFLKIISKVSKDEDIALDLWEGDFEHINFYVVEEEDEIIDYKVPDFTKMDVDYDAKLKEILTRENIDLSTTIKPDLSPGELQTLKTQIAEAERTSAIPAAISTLIGYLDTEKVHEIINSLKELLELCVDSRNFHDAIRIVKKLDEYPDINSMAKFETEPIIVSFKDVLNTAQEDIFNEFMSFINQFSKKSTPHLIRLMTFGKLKERLQRLREAVAYIVQDDSAPFVGLLKDQDIDVLINAIATLGLIKSKETINLLEPLMNHDNTAIRIEIIGVLTEMDKAGRIAIYLDDDDEMVRIKALQSLTSLKYTVIYYDLLRRIKSKIFHELDFVEQREYFNCLVANGGHEVIAQLKKMLFKWVFFKRKRYSILRKLSAMALAEIGTQHILEILRRGAKRKDRNIRSACEMSLRKK